MPTRRNAVAEEITMYVIDAPSAPLLDTCFDKSIEDVDQAVVTLGDPPEDPKLAQRSGTGAWPNGDRAVRTGSCEEVLVTVSGDRLSQLGHLDPNGLFQPMIQRLAVDVSTLRRSRRELAWDVHLRTRPGRRRQASMRIYSSPSGNVTVLTLVPATTSKLFPTAFIRSGLRSMTTVAARLEALTSVQDVSDTS